MNREDVFVENSNNQVKKNKISFVDGMQFIFGIGSLLLGIGTLVIGFLTYQIYIDQRDISKYSIEPHLNMYIEDVLDENGETSNLQVSAKY